MPPIAEHMRIINSLVKNPPAEKLLTKIIPNRKAAANIIPPQTSPDLIPFLPRRFAAMNPAEKQPAHSAKLDISENVPSLRSITVAIAEKITLARKTAPTQARAAFRTSRIRSLRIRSVIFLRRINIPPIQESHNYTITNDYAEWGKIILF